MRRALEVAVPPKLCERETTANSMAPKPRNQNSLGKPNEPVNPDVGAALVPGGPVITATTMAPRKQMPSLCTERFAPKRASCAERAVRGEMPVGAGLCTPSPCGSGVVEVMPPSRAARQECRSDGRGEA